MLTAAGLYLVAAAVHGGRMNLVKRQGDQSSYVQYAKDLYANRQGQQPPIVGDRNRMPLYPAYQSLFYSPALSDEEFFQRGKVTSIALSVALLAGVWWLARLVLPPLAGANVALVAAFTCFAFKAAYFQAELLYYTLHFAAFVVTCLVLTMPAGLRAVTAAAVAGGVAALAHLAKAGALPLAALAAGSVLVASGGPAGRVAAGSTRGSGAWWRLAAAAALTGTFLLVLSPYLITSKRVFGQYFYNVNSTFYVWYDEWGDAVKGTRAHGDRVGWPTLPRDQLPGPHKYWREHSVREIAARIGGGLRQMAIDLWAGFWVFKFAVLYVGVTLLAVWPRRAILPTLLRAHRGLVAFVALYFVVHVLGAAFYAPISGTGVARFSLALWLPLLLATSAVRHHPLLAGSPHGADWLSSERLEWFVAATLVLVVPFSIWPRLLTTYGGY